MSATAAALFAEIDSIAYPARLRLFAARAHELAARGELVPLLAELAGGDSFARRTALFMATVVGERATVERLARDPDLVVRRTALTTLIRLRPTGEPTGHPDLAGLAAVLAEAPIDLRVAAYKALRKGRHAALAAALLEPTLARFGTAEAGLILPACDHATVAAWLERLEHAVPSRGALAHHHPDQVLDLAARQLAALPPAARPDWWAERGSGVLDAAEARPERVLDLLEAYAPEATLPGVSTFGRLAGIAPGRVLALVVAPGRAQWLANEVRLTYWSALPALFRRFAALPVADLVPLAVAVRGSEMFVRLLRAVAPARRAELYEAAYAGTDTRTHRPADAVLDALPHTVRAAEARRVLALGDVAASEELTLHYTAFLPWAEAAEALEAATRRATADQRAAAFRLTVACADRSRDLAAVEAVVTRLAARLRNEQDPVRAQAVAALAAMRPALLTPGLVPLLDRIATDAREARDFSGDGRGHLSALAVHLLRHHVDDPTLRGFALDTLQKLFGDRTPRLGRIDTSLRRGQEHQVAAAIEPWLRAAIARGAYDGLFAIVRALGRRAHGVPMLQDMLGAAALDTGIILGVRQDAIELWLDDRRSRDERVGRLLDADPSTVTLAPVWHVVDARRTDLLDRTALGTRALKGPFVSTGPRWVPGHSLYVSRWLPRQQQRYAYLLGEVIADDEQRMATRTSAISMVARIPGVGWDAVRALAGSDQVPLAEAALGALVHTDRPADALPILLAEAGSDRARVGMYAASRAARFVPPADLLPILSAVGLAAPGEGVKVTGRKEALRLLAALAVPGAPAVLTQAWRTEGQHRDVRAAVVSAARQRLDDPVLFGIVAEAVDGSREDALAALGVVLWEVAEERRPAVGELIGRGLAAADPYVAIAAWDRMRAWGRYVPGLAAAASTRLTDLADRLVWPRVVLALAGIVADDIDRGLLAGVAGALADTSRGPAETADDEQDRPARRRLTHLVDSVLRSSGAAPPEWVRDSLALAGRALQAYPEFSREAARLRAGAIDWPATTGPDLAGGLAELAALLADRPVAQAGLAQTVAGVARKAAVPVEPRPLREAARMLAASGEHGDGLLAAALAWRGERHGWPAAWRDLVYELREHPIASVRDAAFDITLAA